MFPRVKMEANALVVCVNVPVRLKELAVRKVMQVSSCRFFSMLVLMCVFLEFEFCNRRKDNS